MIKTNDDSFYLEPAWYYVNVSSSYHSIIYKESDVVFQFHDHHHGYDGRSRSNFDHFEEIHRIQQLPHKPFHSPTKDADIFASPIFNNSKDFAGDASDINSFARHRSESRRGRNAEPEQETVRTCNLYVIIDHTFYEMVGSDLMRALGEVAYHIEETDTVYRGTDFNGDGIGK